MRQPLLSLLAASCLVAVAAASCTRSVSDAGGAALECLVDRDLTGLGHAADAVSVTLVCSDNTTEADADAAFQQTVAGNVQEISVTSCAFTSEVRLPAGLKRLVVRRGGSQAVKALLAPNTEGLNIQELELTESDLDNSDSVLLASFKEHKKLQRVVLSENGLDRLKSETLKPLEQLLWLDVGGNALDEAVFDAAQAVGETLLGLNVSHNRLKALPSNEWSMPKLRALDVSGNGLESLGSNALWSAVKSLETLSASGNIMTQFSSEVFKNSASLNSLNLRNNSIRNVSLESVVASLQSLDLSMNLLAEVPNLSGLTGLISVDLSFNAISVVRSGAFSSASSQLSDINLSGNSIDTVEAGAFAERNELKILNLFQNRIKTLALSACCPHLRALRIDSNAIGSLEDSLVSLPSLQWLNASNNSLTSLNWSELPVSLEWLDVHVNKIERITAREADHNSLHTLDLSGNKLKELLPLQFPRHLQQLTLSDNEIGNIDDGAFSLLEELGSLDLFANRLTQLRESALFFGGNRKVTVFLGGNRFRCDCQLAWIWKQQHSLDFGPSNVAIVDMASLYCSVARRGDAFLPLSEATGQDFLCEYTSHCQADCNCCQFDACDCNVSCPANCTCSHDDAWAANVIDCSEMRLSALSQAPLPISATDVRLDGNRLRVVTHKDLVGRQKVARLWLNASHVEVVEAGAFAYLTALVELQLQDNLLEQLSEDALHGLVRLERLFLNNNRLRYLSAKMLESLLSLRELRLHSNQLQTFALWTLPPNVEKLSLQDNPWACANCSWRSGLATWKAAHELCKAPCSDRSDGEEHAQVLTGVIIGAVVAAAVLSVVILAGALCCAFRQRILFAVYSRFGVRLGTCSSEDISHDMCHDAAVVFCGSGVANDDGYVDVDAVSSWVQQSLLLDLEQSPPYYSLQLVRCGVPSDIVGGLREHAMHSARVLVLVSSHFLLAEWSCALVDALRSLPRPRRSAHCIFVLCRGVTPKQLCPELRRLVRAGHTVRQDSAQLFRWIRFLLPYPPACSLKDISIYDMPG